MDIRRFEVRLEERLDMNLHAFIRKKADVEGFYDYEIAKILNVDPPVVGKLRKTYGIRRSNSFARRFEKRYGDGSVATFNRIAEEPRHSLSDAARYFGFSREYSRQVYEKINGYPYTITYKNKLPIKTIFKRIEGKVNRERPEGSRLYYVTKIRETAEHLGLSIIPQSNGVPYCLLINGYKIVTKRTFRIANMQYRPHLRFSRTNLRKKDVDFFICVFHEDGYGIHFVIPYGEMPKCGAVIPIEYTDPNQKKLFFVRNSKYFQYNEAWHLLQR